MFPLSAASLSAFEDTAWVDLFAVRGVQLRGRKDTIKGRRKGPPRFPAPCLSSRADPTPAIYLGPGRKPWRRSRAIAWRDLPALNLWRLARGIDRPRGTAASGNNLSSVFSASISPYFMSRQIFRAHTGSASSKYSSQSLIASRLDASWGVIPAVHVAIATCHASLAARIRSAISLIDSPYEHHYNHTVI